jgi:hypothetical protein
LPDLRDRLLAAAERRGFPSVQLRPGASVIPGREAWALFAARASKLDCKAAGAALRDVPAVNPERAATNPVT